MGLLRHWAHGGRRDFSGITSLVPGRYEVEVKASLADARQLMSAR